MRGLKRKMRMGGMGKGERQVRIKGEKAVVRWRKLGNGEGKRERERESSSSRRKTVETLNITAIWHRMCNIATERVFSVNNFTSRTNAHDIASVPVVVKTTIDRNLILISSYMDLLLA